MRPYEKIDARIQEIVFAVFTEREFLDSVQLKTKAALEARAKQDEETGLMARDAMEQAFAVFLEDLYLTYGSGLSGDQHLEIVRRTGKVAEEGSRKSFEETYSLYASLLASESES